MIEIFRVRINLPSMNPAEISNPSIWSYFEAINPETAINLAVKNMELVGLNFDFAIAMLAEPEKWFEVERLEVAEKIALI